MGRTWKSVVLVVVVGLAAVCSAHGQPVPFVADADARACLALSYRAIPQFSSRHVDPNDPPMPDTDEWPQSAAAQGSVIVSYVGMLVLLSAVVSAIGSLLALALAGIIVKLLERPIRPAVSATSSHLPFVLVPARKLPV